MEKIRTGTEHRGGKKRKRSEKQSEGSDEKLTQNTRIQKAASIQEHDLTKNPFLMFLFKLLL